MPKKDYTRREFLSVSAALAATGVVVISWGGCGNGNSQNGDSQGPPRDVYRLSLRSRRGSQAALKHNANKLFATATAADRNRAHAGDKSRIVSFQVSREDFDRLFDNGNRLMVDLRNI